MLNGYVILDLQEAKEIAAVSWAPRDGYADRCVGAIISGSNDGNTWTNLYTIEEVPAKGKDTFAYYTDFNTTEHTYRYIKYWVPDDGKSNCNLSELKVYESAPGIESQKAVSAATYNGSEPKLPAKVEVTLSNGETAEIPVKWDLSEIDISYDEMELFDSVTVTGTSTEANGTVTGYIICAPDNLEYLIDCMTGDSEIPEDGKYVSAAWTAASGLDSLLNTNSSDQKKTDDKAWGYTTNSGLNSWAYAMGNDLYGFGYWAGDGASIEYQLALPEGEHDIMLGCYDFWSGRTMNVYYKVGDGEKQLLCELESNHNTGSTSGGTITLEEDADVTLSVEKGKGGDPVLSWISVAKKKSSEENTMKAHYDMSHNGSSLTDISGNGNNATLYDTSDADFGVYEGEEVLQFNNKQYATLPKGIITDGGSFTVQAVVSAPTQGDNWVWCIGDGIGTWGDNNVGNHIFMSANSSQGNYGGSVLGAVMVGKVQGGGEARMPVPSQKLGSGYTTITMVSDGQTLIMYMDGKEVSRLEGHGKDVSQIIPDGDILGYIGRSLYSPDKKLIANVADIKIWDEALTAKKVSKAVPSAEEKMNMVLADIQKVMLNGNASVNEIETNIKLPGSVDGYDLTWTIPENEAIAQDGKVTIPLEDVNVDVKVEYGDGQEATFALTVPGENIDKILDTAAAELDIPNKDDVRGNITLPAETESKVAITWTTSHPDIVDVNAQEEKVEGYGQVPAGVVTRPAEDTEVTMTATLNYKDATKTKEIKLQVKAAPEKITEKDYTDYFFAYFAGEGYSDGEQIYFASSQDGMNWDDLNNNKPVLTSTLGEEGVRDPFIIRSPEGDKFYMIATDLKIYNGNGWDAAQNRGSQSLMVWESTDLVNWSEQRMVEVSADIEAGCTWAPEATYDPATGEYVVYWASRTPKLDNKQRLYYAKTRDFYTFTTPQLYIEKDQSSIDTTMIEENGTYYRYTKNEGGETNELGAKTKTIFLEKSNNVLGTFESIPSDSLNKYQWVEGPTIFKLNEDDATDTAKWCLLVDEFSAGGYYPLLASDLSTGEFVRPEAGTYKMPSRARHGTPIRVTSDEYAKIMAAYATPDKVNVATTAGTAPTLPETVMVGKTEENVTWNLEGVSFEADAYQIVQVTGTTDSGKEAIANVQVIPTNVEYMIDCANEGSQTWKNAAALNTGILNAGTADQEKTDDNTWGYVSTISESGDMAIYSGSSITDPYEGGYWARGGKNISYQVTLPAGEHTFMFGANGNWWSQGRKMKVYYSVNGSEEKELCDFIQTKNVKSYSTGTLTLSEKAVVTLTVKKNGNADPVLSWITVCGTPDKPDVIDYTELQNQIKAAKALKESDYTPASFAAVTTALNQAEALLNNAADQDEADAAASALADAISGLVEAADFTELQKYYDANKDIQGSYTEESYTKYVNARNAAAAVLENKNAAQAEVDEALENLKVAVEALEEIQKVDKTELKKLYDKCKAIEQGNYTEESYQALQDALKVAKEVLDNENATESDLKVGYE